VKRDPRTARRLLWVALTMLVVVVVFSAASREEPRPAEVAGPPPAARDVVEGRLPADGTVRASVGDLVRVDVASTTRDRAEIVALGVDGPVGPGERGELEFVAVGPGRFDVELRWSGERAGTVVVER
jgi:hypothetical protein